MAKTMTATERSTMAVKFSFLLVSFTLLTHPVWAATFTVTKTTDSLDGKCDQDCSFREAITAANTRVGNDIVLLPGTGAAYQISLSGNSENGNRSGDLDIKDDLQLQVTGTLPVEVRGNNQDRVFHILPKAHVSLENLRITGGTASSNFPFGGGVLNTGELSLKNCTVAGNTASRGGGGLMNQGKLVMELSTIQNNTTIGDGGGINNDSGGSLTVINGSVTGNQALSGGGIYNTGLTVTLQKSQIQGNSASLSGGGIWAGITKNVELTNTTITGNAAKGGPDGTGVITLLKPSQNVVGDTTGLVLQEGKVKPVSVSPGPKTTTPKPSATTTSGKKGSTKGKAKLTRGR